MIHSRLLAIPFLSLLLFFSSACTTTAPLKIGAIKDKTGPVPVAEDATVWQIETTGGNEGREIAVTNLNAEGPGSLADALSQSGARRIIFMVGGVIDLGARALTLTNPYVTVDAASAPEPGITLIRGGLVVATHDVIIRHLRIRVGEAGHAKRSGWEMDGITTIGGAHDVIIEHCSISWATDENLSISGPRFEGSTPEEWRRNTSHRILLRNNIIAEGLSRSTHSEEEHSKGSLIHDNVTEVALLGNLYLSNMQRNPLIKGGAQVFMANNVIHNPGRWGIHYGVVGKEWTGRTIIPGSLVAVANVLQFGPSTPLELPMGSFQGPCLLFKHDNRVLNPRTANLAVPWVGQFTPLEKAPFWLNQYRYMPSEETLDWVLANVGARPWFRDDTDTRYIRQVRERRGKIINSEVEGGGYPSTGL